MLSRWWVLANYLVTVALACCHKSRELRNANGSLTKLFAVITLGFPTLPSLLPVSTICFLQTLSVFLIYIPPVPNNVLYFHPSFSLAVRCPRECPAGFGQVLPPYLPPQIKHKLRLGRLGSSYPAPRTCVG